MSSRVYRIPNLGPYLGDRRIYFGHMWYGFWVPFKGFGVDIRQVWSRGL